MNLSRLFCGTALVGLTGLSLASCTNQETKPSAPGGGGGEKQVSCTLGATGLSSSSASAMADHFGRVAHALSNLTASEREYLFVDRDAKGNFLTFSTQPAPVAPWSQKDLEVDKIPGTSTERAYAEPGLIKEGQTVVVAVVDSGIDLNHEDLKGHIWSNPKETKDGQDEDKNGYVDDLHGWNFLGSKDGTQKIGWTNLEVTREVRRMRKLKAERELTAEESKYLADIETQYAAGRKDAADKLVARKKSLNEFESALSVLKQACNADVTTAAALKGLKSQDQAILAARDVVLKYVEADWSVDRFHSSIEHWTNVGKYYYNVDFDPSGIVGDNPADLKEVGYGNADNFPINAEEAHGTHVAGIIAGIRGNGVGVDGQASNVQIMSLRAVPDGDERDKDVANAIRYAVDNGARVINMSFGKAVSPNKEIVWEALKYADQKNVLVVHAAGNDSSDNDTGANFPTRVTKKDADGKPIETIDSFIEVGASTKNPNEKLPATFSNYGQTGVDLFAPGAAILSSVPGNQYAEFDGTSMASPEVAGVAALVLSQYPKLSSRQLKQILLSTSRKFEGLTVLKPTTEANPAKVLFSSLSVTGGVVNAYSALKAASAVIF